MRVIQISVPAVLYLAGQDHDGISLALSIRDSISVSTQGPGLTIDTVDQHAYEVQSVTANPVYSGLLAVLRKHSVSVSGLSIRIENIIPSEADLGYAHGLRLAGLIAGDFLTLGQFDRLGMLATSQLYQVPPHMMSAMLFGGIGISRNDASHNVKTSNCSVLLIRGLASAITDTQAVSRGPGRGALLVECIRSGNLAPLRYRSDITLEDYRSDQPVEQVLNILADHKAAIVCSRGRSILAAFFGPDSDSMEDAYQALAGDILPAAFMHRCTVDNQGIIISEVGNGTDTRVLPTPASDLPISDAGLMILR